MAIIIQKTPESCWKYYGYHTIDILIDPELFKSKVKITRKTSDCGNTKDVEIAGPLKSLSNFWRTLEMLQLIGKLILF